MAKQLGWVGRGELLADDESVVKGGHLRTQGLHLANGRVRRIVGVGLIVLRTNKNPRQHTAIWLGTDSYMYSTQG